MLFTPQSTVGVELLRQVVDRPAAAHIEPLLQPQDVGRPVRPDDLAVFLERVVLPRRFGIQRPPALVTTTPSAVKSWKPRLACSTSSPAHAASPSASSPAADHSHPSEIATACSSADGREPALALRALARSPLLDTRQFLADPLPGSAAGARFTGRPSASVIPSSTNSTQSSRQGTPRPVSASFCRNAS